MAPVDLLRAYRVTLCPNAAQRRQLAEHAGAARWAFNLTHSAKRAARRIWKQRVRALVDQGTDLDVARKSVKVVTPNYRTVDKARVRVRGTGRSGKPEKPDWPAARQIFIDAGIEDEVADAILAEWIRRARCDDRDPVYDGIAPWLSAAAPNSVVQRAESDCEEAWKRFFANRQGSIPLPPAGRSRPRRITRPCGGPGCDGPCTCRRLTAGNGSCSLMCHCRCDCEPRGFPRFKRKGGRQAFYLNNIETGLIDGSNRDLRLGGKLGVVHTMGDGAIRRIRRALRRGATIQSVTVSAGGQRWYASVLLKEPLAEPVRPTRRQLEAGKVGVDLGVSTALALSTGETIDRPTPDPDSRRGAALARARAAYAGASGRAERRQLARRIARLEDPVGFAILAAEHAMARRVKGSNGWREAVARLGQLKHLQAKQGAGWLHLQTKTLTTRFAEIVIEDLDVRGMARSAKGNAEAHGVDVRSRARRNRRVMKASFGEFRRQVEYKTGYYGSRVIVADRWFASSKICSHCGATKAKLPLSVRWYVCDSCGFEADRDVNAARNLSRCMAVACGERETKNARTSRYGRSGATPEGPARVSREGPSGSPQVSNDLPTP